MMTFRFSHIPGFTALMCFLGFILALLFSSFPGFCKEGDATYNKDTAIIRLLIDRARTTPDSALILYSQALHNSKEAEYSDGVVLSLIGIGTAYNELGNTGMSINYLEQALALSTTAMQKFRVHGTLGSAYVSMGDNVRATEQFHKALRILEGTNTSETGNSATIYLNLGQIYRDNKQYNLAIEYLKKGERIASDSKNYHALVGIKEVEASCYPSLAPEKIREYLFEALALAEQHQFVQFIAQINNDIGISYLNENQHKQAIGHLRRAMVLSESKNSYIFVVSSLSLAAALIRTDDFREPERILKMVIGQSRNSGYKAIEATAYYLLAWIYRTEKKYEKALLYTDSLIALKDTTRGIEQAKAISMMEVKYKTAQKDKQILQQKEQLGKKNTWIASVTGAIMVILVLSAGLYNKMVSKQRLQAEQIKSLGQENKIAVLKAAVKGEDNERTRIARDLHDGIGGMLSAAIMRFSTIHHDNKMIKDLPAYRESMDMFKEVGNEIRKTAHNLMPEVLLKQSLPEAIQNYCNNIREGSPLQISFQSYGSFDDVPEYYRLNIYRMVQELLKNMRQHAAATNALVQLTTNQQTITITVEDDGVGFDTGSQGHGLGLINLQTRVSSLDGTLAIKSAPGNGTSVFIELPFI